MVMFGNRDERAKRSGLALSLKTQKVFFLQIKLSAAAKLSLSLQFSKPKRVGA